MMQKFLEARFLIRRLVNMGRAMLLKPNRFVPKNDTFFYLKFYPFSTPYFRVKKTNFLLSQSCLAPGFTTLMANLFAMRSGDTNSDMEVWQRDYLSVRGGDKGRERYRTCSQCTPGIRTQTWRSGRGKR